MNRALAVSFLLTLFAWNPSPTWAEEPTSGLVLKDNKPTLEALKKAQLAIGKKDWKAATEVLQKIVASDDPVYVPVERKLKQGKKFRVLVNARGEAHRIIGSLPAAGLAQYRMQYEPKAKDLLKTWEKKKDEKLLIKLLLLYQHTSSAKEALRLFALHFFEQKSFTRAAVAFARYFQIAKPEEEEPLLLLRAVIAFHCEGDSKSKALAWKHLQAKIQKNGIHWNNKQWTLKQIKDHVEKQESRSRSPLQKDWPMFGGNPQRNGQSQSRGMPNWKPIYRRDLRKEVLSKPNVELNQVIRKQLTRAGKDGRAVLSEATPVVAMTNFEGKTFPLVVYRTWWGLGASDLDELDLFWDTFPLFSSLGSFLGPVGQFLRGPACVSELLEQHEKADTRADLLFSNAINGSIAIHNGRCYGLDDLPALSPLDVLWSAWEPIDEAHCTEKANHLRLFEMDGGKHLTVIGGNSRDQRNRTYLLRDHVFLDVPLHMDNRGLLLAQQEKNLYLISLDVKAEKVLDRQLLARTHDAIDKNFRRRLHAAHLAYDQGMLVCPTNDGGVFGIDVLTLAPQWLFAYWKPDFTGGIKLGQLPEEKGRWEFIPPEKLEAFERKLKKEQKQAPKPRPQPKPKPNPEPWHYCSPIIANGHVIFTAPDDRDHVHCVELITGRLVWKVKRKKDLYLAGIIKDSVLMIGESSCRALSVDTGREQWQIPTGLPSGRGIASHDVYYLPLKSGVKSKKPEIVAIDVAKKKIVERSIAPESEVPGNLLFHGDRLISQTPLDLKVYRLK